MLRSIDDELEDFGQKNIVRMNRIKKYREKNVETWKQMEIKQ